MRISHELAVSILDEHPIGLWVAEAPSGVVVYANFAFRTMLGMDPIEHIGIEETPARYHICDRLGRPYPVEDLPFSRALAAGRQVCVDDLAIHGADGRRVAVRAFATPVKREGRVTHVVVAFEDVTDEARAIEERSGLEQRLAFAVQHAPILLWMVDKDGTITLSEGAALAAIGLVPGQLVGLNVFDVLRDRPDEIERHRRALAGESVSVASETAGAFLQTHMAPRFGPGGEVVGMIGVSTDISESHRLEQQIAQRDRVNAMGTLAASVAHEINNPLTYVLGNLELAMDALARLEHRLGESASSTPLDVGAAVGNLREFLDPACIGAGRIRRITHDLGTFVRSNNADDASADVAGVVKAALSLVGKDVQARARLDVQVAPVATRVRGSEAGLVQVLVNLLVNAWQALPEPDPSHHEISVAVHAVDTGVVIEVADTGPGVPAEVGERIFEPFYTTKAVAEGTGLGLFVCRNIVRACGGEISVHQRAGGGAVFRVSLPIASTNPARDSSPRAWPIAPSPRGRVLVIDDDKMVATVLEAKLHQGGFKTHAASDAQSALRLLLEAPDEYDLVYCDVMMQGMSGISFYETIERVRPALLSRIVLMTGGAFTEHARAFIAARPETTVKKPFDIAADACRRLRIETQEPATV